MCHTMYVVIGGRLAAGLVGSGMYIDVVQSSFTEIFNLVCAPMLNIANCLLNV